MKLLTIAAIITAMAFLGMGCGETEDTPVVDEPVVDEPVVDEPVIDEPVVDEPVVCRSRRRAC